MIGNITPAAGARHVDKRFSATGAHRVPYRHRSTVVPSNSAARLTVPDASRVQDEVTLAQTLDLDPQPARVLRAELAAQCWAAASIRRGFSIDLRKNAGLVYSVESELQAGRTRGIYLVRYACDPQNVGEAQDMVIRDLKTHAVQPVRKKNCAGKALLLRQIPLNASSIEDIAQGFMHRRDLDLALDEPELAAKRYVALSPQKCSVHFRSGCGPTTWYA